MRTLSFYSALSTLALTCFATACGDSTGTGTGGSAGNGGSGGSGGAAAECGNGTVDDGEQCDEGDANSDTGACKTNCTAAACGDNLVGPGEECDDGTANSDTGACTATCTVAKCGDAVVHKGEEECDNGANNGDTTSCTAVCKQATCGDGLTYAGMEECDDGDQNSDSGGCTLACKTNVCGDGHVKLGKEECDDGAANGDTAACTAACKAAKCGDGLVEAGKEGCDDANMVDGDECTNKCTLPACGDGVKQPGEDCDLGAQNANTGACTTLCKAALCGDGFTQAGVEQCDNGAQNANSAACTATCKTATCGDGFVQAGIEECDLGAQNANTGGCTATCKAAKCGDGFIQSGIELCDDGNMVSGDGCNTDCVVSGSPLQTLTYNDAGNGTDQWGGVATDAMGNVYVTGSEQVAGQAQNLLVRKYNAAGAVVWSQSYNNPAVNSNEEGFGITVDANGNVFVIGYETIAGGTTNIYLAKHNGVNGALIWNKSYDGAGANDYGWGVVANPAGDIFIAAQLTSVVAQGTDILVAKVAGINGTQVWIDLVGGPVIAGQGNNDVANGITLDAQGAVIATGAIQAATGLDIWTRKYTDVGVDKTIVWTRTVNGTGNLEDVGYGVTTDPMNNVIVAGSETVTGQLANHWVRKYDPAGNEVWTQKYGSPSNLNDILYGVDADSDGSIVVGGFEALANNTADVFVRKYSAAGAVLWTQKYNGNADQDDLVNALVVGPAGNVYVAGYETTTGQSSNAWLRKYAP